MSRSTSSNLEERVNKIETDIARFKVAGGIIVALLLGWFGLTTWYTIPKAANDAVASSTVGAAKQEIDGLLADAKQASLSVAKLASDGSSVTIGGQCFKPRLLVRCGDGVQDRITWIDNQGECNNRNKKVELTKFVLAQCD
jgi:hypothetical protein